MQSANYTIMLNYNAIVVVQNKNMCPTHIKQDRKD
jgi:hypothetical protein